MPKGQAVRHDFDAPLVGDRNVKIHVCEAHVACDRRASFAADARDGMLQGQRTGGEHARRRTGGAVVAERVEHTVAAASARCEREGESQAPQQKDTELRTGDGHVIAGGQNVEGAGGELPCLREQQRTRRRSEVSKMRLIRALIARTGSDALPSPERPGVVSTVRGGGDGDGAGAEGCPFWRLVTNMAQLCLGVDCCGGRWQGPVALQGSVETGGRSRRPGLDDGQSVAPGSPVRCVAVNAGGAETEPSEPLRKRAERHRATAASCSAA